MLKLSLTTVLVIAVSSALSVPARANTITFSTAAIGLVTGSVTENGFTYSTLSGWLLVHEFGNPGNDMEGLYSGGGGGLLKIVSANGGNFNFDALDFSAWSSDGTGSQILTVDGFLNGAFVGTDHYTLDDTGIGFPTYANWTTEDASGLAGIPISQLGVTLQSGLLFHENIDNVVLTPVTVTPPSTVPEPASMVLFGTGLLGLAALVRRRKLSSNPTL